LGWLKTSLTKLCGTQVLCFGVLGISKIDSLSSRNKDSLQHSASSTTRNGDPWQTAK